MSNLQDQIDAKLRGAAGIGQADKCVQTTNAKNYAMAMEPVRMPLKEQLEKSAVEADDVRRRQQRAYDILSRHPEFEEFLGASGDHSTRALAIGPHRDFVRAFTGGK